MQVCKSLTRIFIAPAEMNASIAFYEELFGEKCGMRFAYSEKGLELAMVGSFLLVSGSPDKLEPFRETKVTFLVDSVDAFMEHLEKKGAILLEYPKAVPTGKNMRVKHPDGLVAEYVEHT